jgi:hypothetical protein
VWTFTVMAYVAMVGADLGDHSRFFLPALPSIFALAVSGVASCLECRSLGQRIVVASVPVAFVWYVWGPLAGACAFATAAVLALCAGNSVTPTSWLGVASTGVLVSALGATRWREQPKFPHWIGGEYFPRVVFMRSSELVRLRMANEIIARGSRNTSQRLAATRPPVRSVAALGIGVLGYEYRGRVVDIFGLTDPVISRTRIPKQLETVTVPLPGHLRVNADRVLSLRPDCILIPRDPTPIPIPAHIAILLHPDLRRLYRWNPFIDGFCIG